MSSPPRLQFDHFHTYEEIEGVVRGLAAAFLDLCRAGTIGRSREGREIQLLTITDFATGEPDTKPGYLTHGGIHAHEPAPAHGPPHIAERILDEHQPAVDDRAKLHANRLARLRNHGSVVFERTSITESELSFVKNGFGLGYHDGDRITHHVWALAKGEAGPYSVYSIAYETADQLLELLALLSGLSDQVHLIRMQEPPQIQLLDRPLRGIAATRRAEKEQRIEGGSWSRLRILERCAAATQVPLAITFNLILTDLAEGALDRRWTGLSGDYFVSFWRRLANRAQLPELKASVRAFSRPWAGARPASSPALTDDLVGPPELLEDLDRSLPVPRPNFDWPF